VTLTHLCNFGLNIHNTAVNGGFITQSTIWLPTHFVMMRLTGQNKGFLTYNGDSD